MRGFGARSRQSLSSGMDVGVQKRSALPPMPNQVGMGAGAMMGVEMVAVVTVDQQWTMGSGQWTFGGAVLCPLSTFHCPLHRSLGFEEPAGHLPDGACAHDDEQVAAAADVFELFDN